MPGCPSYTLCLKTRPEPEPNELFLGPYSLCLACVAPRCKFVLFTDMCCMLKVASSGWPAQNERSMKMLMNQQISRRDMIRSSAALAALALVPASFSAFGLEDQSSDGTLIPFLDAQ